MKKKVFGGLLAGLLIIGQGMSVFAAGSASENVLGATATDADGNTVEVTTTTVTADEVTSLTSDVDAQAVLSAIIGSNSAKVSEALSSVAAVAENADGADIANAEVISDVVDVTVPEGTVVSAEKPLTVSFGVAVPEGKTVYAVHFRSADSKWEVLPVTVNGSTVKVTFTSLSPVFFAAVDTVSNGGNGNDGNGNNGNGNDGTGTGSSDSSSSDDSATSPKTADTAPWVVWVVAGAALCVIVVLNRKGSANR